MKGINNIHNSIQDTFPASDIGLKAVFSLAQVG